MFTNIINCTYWVGLSGLYKINRTRLYDQAVGELIALEDGVVGVTEEKETKKNEAKESKKQPQPQQPPELKEIKSGWLLKRSTKKGKTSGWKKRYCVIREDGLSYYDKENMPHEERRGVVPFNTIRIVEVDLSVESTGKKGEKACIVVFCDDGRYEFASTGDGQELKGWAQLLSTKARVELGEVKKEILVPIPATSTVAPSSASVLSPRSATPPPMAKQPSSLMKKPSVSAIEEMTPEQMIQNVQPALLFVAKKGLYKQNIFRNVGDQTEVEALAAAWKLGQKMDLSSLEKCQVANVAGAIRVYYRELPAQALLGESQFQVLLEVNKKADKTQKVDAASGVIQNPLLLLLFDLLSKVASNSRLNKMTSSNLASVFAPTFLRSAEHGKDPAVLLEHTKAVVASLDFIIMHFNCCSLSSEIDAKWAHEEEDQQQQQQQQQKESLSDEEEEQVVEDGDKPKLEFSDFQKEIKGKAKIDLDFNKEERRSRRPDGESPPPLDDKKKNEDRKSDRDVPPQEPAAPPPLRQGVSFSSLAPRSSYCREDSSSSDYWTSQGKERFFVLPFLVLFSLNFCAVLPFKTPAPKPPVKVKSAGEHAEDEERKPLPKPPSKNAAVEEEGALRSSDEEDASMRPRGGGGLSPLNIDVEGFEESPRREASPRVVPPPPPPVVGRGRGRGAGEELELARGRARGRAVELPSAEESEGQGRGRGGRGRGLESNSRNSSSKVKEELEEDLNAPTPTKSRWRDRGAKNPPSRQSKPPNASLLDDTDEEVPAVDEGRKVDIADLLHDSDDSAETRDIDVPQGLDDANTEEERAENSEQQREQPVQQEEKLAEEIQERSPLVSPIELDENDVVRTPVRPSKKDPSARVKPVVVEKKEEEANSDQEFLEPMEDVFE